MASRLWDRFYESALALTMLLQFLDALFSGTVHHLMEVIGMLFQVFFSCNMHVMRRDDNRVVSNCVVLLIISCLNMHRV